MNKSDLSDDKIIEMIVDQLEEDGRIHTDFVVVECVGGRPVIRGRVGSDEEIHIVDEILNDVLDIHDFENNLWVDDALAFENSEESQEVDELPVAEESEELEEESPLGDDGDEEDSGK